MDALERQPVPAHAPLLSRIPHTQIRFHVSPLEPLRRLLAAAAQ